MALLPDPTTAASERSSVKNGLTGSRRRGSGIKNRHGSRTVSKTSLRGARRMRVQGVQGQGCPQHESTQPGPLTLLPHQTRVRHKKGTGQKNTKLHPGLCAGGSSRTNGSRYPPSAHAFSVFNRLHQLGPRFMRQQSQRLGAFMLCTSFPEISWTRMRLPCLPS